MKTDLHLQLRQSQTLAMTPQMQQSIKLLQMTHLELNEYIQQTALENPFLNVDSPEDQFEKKPQDTYDESDRFQSYWKEMRVSKRTFNDDDQPIEDRLTRSVTLHDHLREQLGLSTTDPELRKIGDYLIDLVEDDGYIRQTIDDIQEETSFDRDKIHDTLDLLQTFDPVGVCALTLEEGLTIQLREQGILTPQLMDFVENIKLLTEKGAPALANHCGISLETLRSYLEIVKTLNPKPGLSYCPVDVTEYVIPEVYFRRSRDGTWECELNGAVLPRVHIDRESYLAVTDRSLKPEDKSYISQNISSANWLLKGLRQRTLTLLKVSQAIIQHQQDFLNKGMMALLPMTLKNLAQELGMHESTVSRAVTGKYVSTPYGVMELKKFFSSAVNQDQPGTSNKVIQLEIKKLITSENKLSPLSDDQLVSQLRGFGYVVARRTVTKYREALQIPSSYERKKIEKLLTF